jgi:hypothetical protein
LQDAPDTAAKDVPQVGSEMSPNKEERYMATFQPGIIAAIFVLIWLIGYLWPLWIGVLLYCIFDAEHENEIFAFIGLCAQIFCSLYISYLVLYYVLYKFFFRIIYQLATS